MKISHLMVMVAVPALLCTVQSVAQTTANEPASSTVAPDNTRSNKVDASNRTTTADNQKNNASDIDLTKRIRQSVMADKSLFTDGHNVKIIAVNGTVTLNGVVSNQDEKTRIAQKAATIAGEGHVVDALKLASSQ